MGSGAAGNLGVFKRQILFHLSDVLDVCSLAISSALVRDPQGSSNPGGTRNLVLIPLQE